MSLLNSHTIPNYRKKSRKMKIELINEKVFRVKFYTFPLIYPFFNCFFFSFHCSNWKKNRRKKWNENQMNRKISLLYIFFFQDQIAEIDKKCIISFMIDWNIFCFSFVDWKGWRNWWKFFMEVVGGVWKSWGPYYTTKYQPLPRIHQNHRLSST